MKIKCLSVLFGVLICSFIALAAHAMTQNEILNFNILDLKLNIPLSQAEAIMKKNGFTELKYSSNFEERNFEQKSPYGDKSIVLSITQVKNVPIERWKDYSYVWKINYYNVNTSTIMSPEQVDAFKDSVIKKYGPPSALTDNCSTASNPAEYKECRQSMNWYQLIYSVDDIDKNKPKLDVSVTNKNYAFNFAWPELYNQKSKQYGVNTNTLNGNSNRDF